MRTLGILAILLLGACSSDEGVVAADTYADEYGADGPGREDVIADVSANLADSTYEGESYAYGCTSDCSGHEAGWAYAAENGVTDAAECGGSTSQSFDEGCVAYAEELESRVETTIAENE